MDLVNENSKLKSELALLKQRYGLLLESLQNVCQEVLARKFSEPVIEKPKSIVRAKTCRGPKKNS
jgi:hypothetical protein